MTTNLTLSQAADYLLAHDDYLLLSHRRPDGDTVGSCAALCMALRALGKRAWVYPNPQFTPKFAFLLNGLLPQAPEALREARNAEAGSGALPYTVVTCDIATRSLFPFGAEDFPAHLALDHHGTNEGFASFTHTDEHMAACGELLVDLLPLLGVEMTPAMAEAVYVAISTDTGCFRYSNVSANTFRCAAACVRAGARIYPINRDFFEIKRKPRLRLEAHLVENMEFFAGGKVAVSAIPQSLIDELGLTEDDIDDISGFGRAVEGVKIAVMLREVENGMGKASVRTSQDYNAARICARLGGGGHPAAAGANVPGGIPAIREAVLRSIAQEIEL